MIAYHGTPIGGTRPDVAESLQGRHALVPFARPDDLAPIMDRCQSFIADNSAFTYWKQGGTVDVDAYVEWVRTFQHHPGFDWCLIPDVIDGTEDDNRKMITDWMRAGRRIKGVPVYHMHEELSHLEWLIQSFDIIALGSSGQWPNPGTVPWWHRMNEIMRVACHANGQPRCKLHGLRMLDPEIFRWLPLHSADSTNAAVNSGSIKRFGMYIPPSRATRFQIIADRIEIFNSAHVWQEHQREMEL